MKLNSKVGGICASLTFLITAIPGFYQQARPTDLNFIAANSFSGMAVVETLAISLLGAMAAWMIGYTIGEILSNPQKAAKQKAQPMEVSAPPPVVPTASSGVPEDNPEPDEDSDLTASPESATAPAAETPDLE
ncbi:hypothetical protein [Vampirovibrio chlorellavorus]|uniref:hypothetical protein n=1 Tax=Vampirovibrio chlorellavorus TaxID=758823 RepID=UPI0026ED735B|nr:hypothetical protein [Vampirovibrio chlorellavorus]